VQFIGPISQGKNPDWSFINQDDLSSQRFGRVTALRHFVSSVGLADALLHRRDAEPPDEVEISSFGLSQAEGHQCPLQSELQ
jgi:hypothetical protein